MSDSNNQSTDDYRSSELIPDASSLEKRLQAFNIYRQRTVDEYNFISHRLNLMVLVEGVFLALFAATLSASGNGAKTSQTILSHEALRTLLEFTAFFGIIVALFSLLSVLAAVLEVEHLKKTYIERYLNKGNPMDNEPWLKLTGHKMRFCDFHIFGHILPVSLPIIVVFLWAVIACHMIFYN